MPSLNPAEFEVLKFQVIRQNMYKYLKRLQEWKMYITWHFTSSICFQVNNNVVQQVFWIQILLQLIFLEKLNYILKWLKKLMKYRRM